jgi:flagellar hook-associated protein 3 FlgL
MRVSTSFIQQSGLQQILDLQTRVVKAQNQISLGSKILNPSDDPTASSRIIDLNEGITRIDQFNRNADFATQRLNLEETSLESAKNVLQRVRELSIQAANTGGLDLLSEQAIAKEMSEKLDELMGYANSKDSNGDFIFSGFQSSTQPFTTDGQGNYFYNGDQGQSLAQVGANRQVVVSDSGADVFQLVRNGNGDFSVDASRTNAGTAIITTGSVLNSSIYQAEDFTINFTTATTFDVVNNTTGVTTLTAQPFTDGAAITFNGMSVEIEGAPVAGDTFAVEASRNQDIFTTINSLITDLNSPSSGNVTGDIGGDFINNGFDVGDTVAFDFVFDGQTIPISYTVAGGDTNANIAAGIMADIAVDANVTANLDGSFSLAGTTTGNSMIFSLNGTNINFRSVGGTGALGNDLVINNMTDDNGSATGNVALMDLSSAGNSVVPSATVTVGGTGSFVAGPGSSTLLNQQIANALNSLDQSMDKIVDTQTSIGGRINSIESQIDENGAKKLHLETVLSQIKDLDFAEAVGKLTFDTTALQIAQKTFSNLQNLNLFQFI